jgi:Protein of unknown function (DUF1769)
MAKVITPQANTQATRHAMTPPSIHASPSLPQKAIENDPAPLENWSHRPVYLRSNEDTYARGNDTRKQELPLGIPFEFESPLFKGTMLVRLRNVSTDDRTGSHEAYFKGRKRLMQTVVQGQFKEPVKMSDVYFGSVFSKPLAFPPPPSMQKIMNGVFKRLAPSVILDLTSQQPKVLALYAGSAQTMRVDEMGKQPDICAVDIPENLLDVRGAEGRSGRRSKNKESISPSERKKLLSSPKNASQYTFDTEHVYTFHTYDDTMDYGGYSVKLPVFGRFRFGFALGKQPMTISAVLKDGSSLFSFQVWHEDILGNAPQMAAPN